MGRLPGLVLSTRPSLDEPRAMAWGPSDLASAESMGGAVEDTRLPVRRSKKPQGKGEGSVQHPLLRPSGRRCLTLPVACFSF